MDRYLFLLVARISNYERKWSKQSHAWGFPQTEKGLGLFFSCDKDNFPVFVFGMFYDRLAQFWFYSPMRRLKICVHHTF